MDYFLTYAGSVSFRELKNAKKKYFFLNLGGVGAKTRFLSKKNWGRSFGLAGKNIGSACLIYMGEVQVFFPNFTKSTGFSGSIISGWHLLFCLGLEFDNNTEVTNYFVEASPNRFHLENYTSS